MMLGPGQIYRPFPSLPPFSLDLTTASQRRYNGTVLGKWIGRQVGMALGYTCMRRSLKKDVVQLLGSGKNCSICSAFVASLWKCGVDCLRQQEYA